MPLSSRDSREFGRFLRWGWVPVALGTFVICVVAIVVWDLVMRARGVDITDAVRWMFGVRAFVLSAVVAAWSGFLVHRTRRRIEAAREALLHERASLVEQRRRLEQTQGVAAVLRVMAHEIRNPLNGVRLHANVARRALARGVVDAAKESLDQLDAETVRLAELVDEYLELGHAEAPIVEVRPMDVAAAVRGAVEAHRRTLERHGIAVVLEVPDERLAIEGDAKKIAEIIHKLLRNSLEALREGGKVTVRVRREEALVPMAAIEVIDSGPGFADPRVAFRPFYSTKPEGTGLGLSIVHDLVRAHRGEVCAINSEGGGACVRVRLPLSEDRCSE